MGKGSIFAKLLICLFLAMTMHIATTTQSMAQRVCGVMFEPEPGDTCQTQDGRTCVVLVGEPGEANTVLVRCTGGRQTARKAASRSKSRKAASKRRKSRN